MRRCQIKMSGKCVGRKVEGLKFWPRLMTRLEVSKMPRSPRNESALSSAWPTLTSDIMWGVSRTSTNNLQRLRSTFNTFNNGFHSLRKNAFFQVFIIISTSYYIYGQDWWCTLQKADVRLHVFHGGFKDELPCCSRSTKSQFRSPQQIHNFTVDISASHWQMVIDVKLEAGHARFHLRRDAGDWMIDRLRLRTSESCWICMFVISHHGNGSMLNCRPSSSIRSIWTSH